MPDQAGTWLGTRRAETCAAIWMDVGPVPGSDLRQRAGAGRFRTAPTCRGNRRSSPSLRAVRTSGPRANRVMRHTRLAKLRER